MTSHSIFNFFFFFISFRHVPFCGLKTMYTQSSRYGKEKERVYWKRRPVNESMELDQWRRLKVKQTLHICSVHYGGRMGWLHMHLGLYAFVYIWCVCARLSSPPGSGFHHHLQPASLNHVIYHVNAVIAYHYAEVRFQWHHSIQHPIWVFKTCQHWLLFSVQENLCLGRK